MVAADPTIPTRSSERGQATDREALSGLVERGTFHNAESGFCVLRVKVRGHRDLVTVVGHAAMASAGEFIQAAGHWVTQSAGSKRLARFRLPPV